MANHTVTENSITVHGRGSLVLPFKMNDAQGNQINISTMPLFFEIDGISLREALVFDPADPLGRRIMLERAQVELLGSSPLNFAVIDETEAAQDIYNVIWTGTITATGYKGAPDGVAG